MLGVDLGSRRIGLAVSDPRGAVATPLEVVLRGRDRAEDHSAIVRAAREQGVARIVVGLPRSLSGSTGPAERAVLAEVEELRQAAGGLPVGVHDERFTTVIAQRGLREARVKRGARRGVIDQVAAAVMLQSWLDAHRGEGGDPE